MSYGWIGLIVLVLVIYFIFTISDELSIKHNKKSAIDILNERYARGEITEEEYLRMKKIINNK